jgi:ABC-2 type transport system permease protein
LDAAFDPYSAARMSLSDWLIGPWLGNVSVVLVMLAPALAMRTFAEERRSKTLELLVTSPVSSVEIVCGKFAGAMGVVLVLLAGSAAGPLGLFWVAEPDPGVIASGYLGLFLLGAAIVSIGMFFSVNTDNQITALVLTFAFSLTLYLAGVFDNGGPEDWKMKVSLSAHIIDLFRGAVRLVDLVYFAAVTFVCLFATHQRLESHRWG